MVPETNPPSVTPADQAIQHAGKVGIVPPVETRWKPGQSGNPKGRPAVGATMLEWLNELAPLSAAAWAASDVGQQ
jgi:hypothetical protein